MKIDRSRSCCRRKDETSCRSSHTNAITVIQIVQNGSLNGYTLNSSDFFEDSFCYDLDLDNDVGKGVPDFCDFRESSVLLAESWLVGRATGCGKLVGRM